MIDPVVGMFDSGIGGLSVYAEVRKLLPGHDIVYIADQGYGMYGERSLAEVRARSERISRLLIDRGAGVVVVACNSASAAALHHLRASFPETPFVGMEPAVKPAAAVTNNGTIGVLATRATFQGELFASVVDRFAGDHEVLTKACPGLAAAIEDDDPGVALLIDEYVGDLMARGAGVVVLGCTHYSLVRDRIATAAGGAPVVDPAPAVARQVSRVVDGLGPAGTSGTGTSILLTTGDVRRFAVQVERLGYDRTPVGSVEV